MILWHSSFSSSTKHDTSNNDGNVIAVSLCIVWGTYCCCSCSSTGSIRFGYPNLKTSLTKVTLSCVQKVIQLKPFLCFCFSGFTSIDCGLPEASSYNEKTTGIFYISDAKFIDAGVSKSISPAQKSTHLQQLAYVRSFPSGERNCYRINVTSGTKYLIRATFFYGNYDGLNQPPQFDLHLGANIWDTVNFPNASLSEISEIIHTPSLDYIQPCLVNTGKGTPFISAIELRTLNNAFYVTASAESLAYYQRYDLGSITNLGYR